MKVSLDTAETVPEVAKWSPLGEVGVQSKDGTSNMPGPLNRQKDADNLVRPAGTGGYIEQKQVLRSGASEMEMDFVKELEKVQRMAEEVNELMAFIDGRSADAKAEHKKVFTKSVLEDIESGIQNLSTECRNWQLRLVEQRQSISDLCDESMQVDAWRIYVQSLFEQASDCRYQDLWNKQKLHPEMDAMRKRILKVDQSLKQQIAELEEHLHNLELSQRGRMRNLSKNQAISASHNAENFHWLQSLYSTVNTQLGVAEQLAQLMTLQMETLNISLMSKDDVNRLVSTSASKLQNIVLEEQSLTKDSNVFSRSKATLREAGVLSPFKTTMNYAPQTPTKPDAGGTNVGQPDSTRRRRHSVDRLWVDAGAAKTTVKRAAPIGHSEGIFASPKREFRQMEVQQSSHLPGMYATESSIPSFQLSLSRASSASVSMPTVGAEKIITKPVMGGSLGKPAIRSPFDGQAEQTRSSKSSAASSRSITTHAAAPTMSNASLKFSIPTSGSGLNMSTAAISSPQLSFSLTSRPSTVNSTTNLLASQDNFMLGMNAKASASMDSILKPGGLSPSSSSKRSLAVGPLTSASSTAQPPGMQRIGVRAKEDSEVLPSGSHSLMFQSVIPGDLQAKIKMSQMADSLEAKNSSTTEKLEALESTDNASFLPSKVGFQDSTGLMAGARGDKFSSISSKAVPHTSTVISTKRLQESTVPPVPTEKPSIGLLPGAQAGTDMSPVNSFSSSGIDPVTTLSSFSTMVQSLGTSVSSTVSPFVGSTSALFSPSIAKSMVATDLSKFESASSKAGSSTAPSSVPSTVKAATLFGEGITSSPHQVFPPASNVCPPASSATGAAAIVFSENVTATQQVFSPAANASVSPSSFPFRGPPTMSDEEDMEEEASNAIDSGFSSFGGFGLGSSAPSTGLQKANPFGGSPFGGQASSATVLSVPSGQLFKPAAFSLPTLQSSPSQSNENTFGTTFSSGIGSGFMTGVSGFGSPAQPAVSAFGQPAQPGHGQQALGSALGTFGQTRQIGTSFGASATPGAGLGFATSGGFANAATGGGFASAASGGGFGSAPTGGGFAGFSSSGGFGGAGGGVGGGFQSFGGNQGGFGTFSGGPSGFGGNANSSLFTQMRK